MRRYLAILMTLLLVISGLPVYKAEAAAYDPVTQTEGEATLGLRFWEDQKPDIGFYINAGNRYLLETVKEPSMGTTAGEWSVMDLLRGMYTGADYLNHLPDNYFEGYYDRINEFVILKDGVLDTNKSTEWSRLTLAMSALGKDIRSIGTPGTFIKTKQAKVLADGSYAIAHTSNSQGLGVVEVHNNQFTLAEPTAINFEYTNRFNRLLTTYGIIAPGTYTIQDDYTIINEKGEQVSILFDEKASGSVYKTHVLTKIPENGIVVVEKPYDFVEKLSTSYTFAQKQGINGPIWVLIALNTGGYTLYSKEDLQKRGITIDNKTAIQLGNSRKTYPISDLNTEGRMIDAILQLEKTTASGRKGGWALMGTNPDPDITMMAIQGLAPYYFDEMKFKKAFEGTIDLSTVDANALTNPSNVKLYDVESESFKQKYIEFKKAVERAVAAMAEDQLPTGAFKSMGNPNSESTVQVIVGLTALGIDPLSDIVYLPTIDQTVSFIKEGGEYDGVWSNNMVDALTAFWAMTSGSAPEVGGFKHVSAGNDSGGGAGTRVNAMATDQAIYGLIAYDRFLKKQNTLYDMSDMINGEYKTMKAKSHTYTYMSSDTTIEQGTFSPYEVLTIPDPPVKDGYKGFWSTKADGTGAIYEAGEKLSTPDHAITLYAQYAVPYEITYELNDAQWVIENAEVYAPTERKLTLPTAEHVQKDNHVFYGWYTTADFQGEAVTALNDPTQLEHTLYAKWVSFDSLVANAEAAIAQIPAEAQLTTTDAATIQTARAAVDLIPAASVENVSSIDLLTRAEDVLQVLTVEDKIAILPEKLNLTHVSHFEEISEAIQALPGRLQLEIKNIAVFEEKRSIIQQLQQEATDIDHANAIRTLINALPKDITVAHEAQLNEAIAAYDRLTVSQKELLTEEYENLSSLADQLKALLFEQEAAQLQAKISALPETVNITLAHKDAIIGAYEAYLAASSDVKQAVDHKPLFNAVASLIDLQIGHLPANVIETDRPALNAIRYFYQEAGSSIQSLVTNYKKLEQAYVTLDNAPFVAKANEVIAKINLIPANVTMTAKATIEAARAAYESLTATEKQYVSNFYKLTQAESELKKFETALKNDVTKLMNSINQLPATITLTNKNTVTALQNSYNALSATAKAQVTNAQKLVNAVQTITALEAQEKQIVQAMQSAINALPDVASMTLKHQLIIEDVRTKYNSLTATQKASIDTAKLLAAETQLQKLMNTNAPNTNEELPTISEPLVKETDEKLIVQAISSGSESIATITPNWIQSLAVPSIEFNTNNGVRVILPTQTAKQYTKPIQVSTKIHQRGTERSIDVSFGTVDGSQYVARRANKPFTIRIPASLFMSPQTSSRTLAFEPGVILGYSVEKGYYAVPHLYENGEFIVTASEGHTLVHRTEQITFDDIQGSIFQNEIEYLASRFVIKGYDDAMFKPDDKITRGQFAALISRALDLKPTKATTFRDGFYSEFREDMQAVYEAGIMRGYSDTKFGTNEPLTREQAAATMARVLEYMDYDAKRNLAHFKDKEEIDPAFLKHIELLNTLNIMSGHADGSFKPKDQLTRGQLAKVLQRTLALTKVM